MEEKIRAHVLISGRVQGVCFRLETERAAVNFNVLGWVRNRPDGAVEAVFEGDRADVDRMLAWCRQGLRYRESIMWMFDGRAIPGSIRDLISRIRKKGGRSTSSARFK